MNQHHSEELGVPMAVTLAQRLEDRPPMISARPDEGVADAMERVLEHDYSQLPVVTEPAEGKLHVVGTISTTGIGTGSLHVGESPRKVRAVRPGPSPISLARDT